MMKISKMMTTHTTSDGKGMFNWDVDRLHQVIDNDPQERGAGITTAMLAQMVGETQLGDPLNAYLYIGENSDWTRVVAERFRFYATTEGNDVGILGNNRDTVIVNQQRFVFLPPQYVMTAQGLIFSDIWIDVTMETYRRYENVINKIMTRRR